MKRDDLYAKAQAALGPQATNRSRLVLSSCAADIIALIDENRRLREALGKMVECPDCGLIAQEALHDH